MQSSVNLKAWCYKKTKNKIFTLALSILLVSMMFVTIVIGGNGTSQEWLSGYSYRKEIQVTGSNSNLSNYQLPISFKFDATVDTSTLIPDSGWYTKSSFSATENATALSMVNALMEKWTKDSNNPIVPTGSVGTWNAKGSSGPFVMRLSNGTHVMMFAGHSTDYMARPREGGLARSTDGKVWTDVSGNPLFQVVLNTDENDWSGVHGNIISCPNGTYLYYYSSKMNESTNPNYAPQEVFLAKSTDLISWTKYSTTPIIAKNSTYPMRCYPSVIREQNGTYTMYLWESDNYDSGHGSIDVYQSLDGVSNWICRGVAISHGTGGDFDTWRPEVLHAFKVGIYYVLLYEGAPSYGTYNFRIGGAYSTDGVTFTKSSNNPLLGLSASGWDAEDIIHPSAIFDNVTMRWDIYYVGTNNLVTREHQIGLAYSTVVSDPSIISLNSTCKTDFGDVRFTSSDKTTELSYWLRTYTTSTSAQFYVKVPSILTTGTTIYVYWGNDTASTTSDEVATAQSGYADDAELSNNFFDTLQLPITVSTEQSKSPSHSFKADYNATSGEAWARPSRTLTFPSTNTVIARDDITQAKNYARSKLRKREG